MRDSAYEETEVEYIEINELGFKHPANVDRGNAWLNALANIERRVRESKGADLDAVALYQWAAV